MTGCQRRNWTVVLYKEVWSTILLQDMYCMLTMRWRSDRLLQGLGGTASWISSGTIIVCSSNRQTNIWGQTWIIRNLWLCTFSPNHSAYVFCISTDLAFDVQQNWKNMVQNGGCIQMWKVLIRRFCLSIAVLCQLENRMQWFTLSDYRKVKKNKTQR